ncbi:hypothetical protein ACTHAM_002340 [Cellulomonas soli]|uniref:hypothetical protein n=1 Tax=Cellulomonas soli TaxID=931535 RepID=UPI003F8503DF
MKIFGFQAQFQPAGSEVTCETIDEIIDRMHDAFAADANVYSADLVGLGTEQVDLLVGVKVADASGSGEATEFAVAAFNAAFAAAELDEPTLATFSVAEARQLAYAG